MISSDLFILYLLYSGFNRDWSTFIQPFSNREYRNSFHQE